MKILNSKKIKAVSENVNVFSLNLKHPELSLKGEINVNIDEEEIPIPAGLTNAELIKTYDGWEYSQEGNTTNQAFHTGAGVSDLFCDP